MFKQTVPLLLKNTFCRVCGIVPHQNVQQQHLITQNLMTLMMWEVRVPVNSWADHGRMILPIILSQEERRQKTGVNMDLMSSPSLLLVAVEVLLKVLYDDCLLVLNHVGAVSIIPVQVVPYGRVLL